MSLSTSFDEALRRSRLRHGRRAFTKVELLVVIAVVGVLVVMMLMPVGGSRGATPSVECLNNNRQLAQAAMMHNDRIGHWPTGGWGWGWAGDSNYERGVDQPGGWVFQILPYLELDDLWQYDRDRPIGKANQERLAVPQKLLTCPVRRRISIYPHKRQYFNVDSPCPAVARSDYAINSGSQLRCQIWRGPDSLEAGLRSETWADYPTDDFNGISYQRSQVKNKDISDGRAYTYLIAEKYVNPDHYQTGDDAGDNENLYSGFSNDNFRSTAGAPLRDTPGRSEECRFGSAHPHNFSATMCDGVVKMIRFDIDPAVHRSLGNRADGNKLSDSDF